MKTNIEKLIQEQIFLLEPFEEDNTNLEKIFFYISEISAELGFTNLSDLCIEIMLYCKGVESADLSYKTKQDIIEYYESQVK
jgi:hypothetical protein